MCAHIVRTMCRDRKWSPLAPRSRALLPATAVWCKRLPAPAVPRFESTHGKHTLVQRGNALALTLGGVPHTRMDAEWSPEKRAPLLK